MILRQHVTDAQLADLGFRIVKDDDERFSPEWLDSFPDLRAYYNMGYSRRGQSYYILITDDFGISLYASEPDGSGGAIEFDETILDMYDKDMIER